MLMLFKRTPRDISQHSKDIYFTPFKCRVKENLENSPFCDYSIVLQILCETSMHRAKTVVFKTDMLLQIPILC